MLQNTVIHNISDFDHSRLRLPVPADNSLHFSLLILHSCPRIPGTVPLPFKEKLLSSLYTLSYYLSFPVKIFKVLLFEVSEFLTVQRIFGSPVATLFRLCKIVKGFL